MCCWIVTRHCYDFEKFNSKLLTVVRSFVRLCWAQRVLRVVHHLVYLMSFEAMRKVSSRIDKQNLTTVHGILLRYLYVSVNTESYLLRLREVNTKLLTVVRLFVRLCWAQRVLRVIHHLVYLMSFEAMREVSSKIDRQNLTTVHGILLQYLYVSVNTESYPPWLIGGCAMSHT